MSNKSMRWLVYVIKGGLFVLPVLSLIVADFLFFPFITGKNFFFRMMVEVLFFLWVFLAVFDKNYRPKKTPILVALSITLLILILASIFGQNFYRSFWSNYERMEGLVTHLHLFAYFLVLTSVFRSRKDWKIFFAGSLLVSFIVAIYGLLQFFGKFVIHQGQVRLDATFGNATYLAIFLIFHLFIISLFFLWFRNFWLRLLLAAVFLLELVVMFLTATRGAILGFCGGLFLLAVLMAVFSRNKKMRFCFLLVLVGFVILAGLFLFLKNKDFVKKNYVLSRFASISFSDQTTTSRFTIWGMSWKGFQEHPVLGWGPENYNLVFNKYYQPELVKQEPWFDRAHDVVFDWLISAGLFGLASYFGIFIAAFYVLWKLYKRKGFSLLEISLAVSLLAAYFFHNLFVFDNITSYFIFFSVLGYLHASFLSDKPEISDKSNRKAGELSGGGYLVITFSFLLFIFSIYFVNIKPLLACDHLLQSLYLVNGAQYDKALQEFDKVFAYDTFGTTEAREQLSSFGINTGSYSNLSEAGKKKVLDKAVSEMEKQCASYPNDVRYLVFMSLLYSRANRFDDALRTADKALTLSPKKQQIYFIKLDVYMATNQLDKGVGIAKEAYNLDTTYNEAAKNLAVLYMLSGQQEEADSLLLKHFSKTILSDKDLLNAYAQTRQFEKVRQTWLEFLRLNPNIAQYHVGLAATLAQLGQNDEAIRELEKAIELEPNFKEQGEYYINQIRSGKMP